MSYAAHKTMHWPTGIDHCAAGFITHSPAEAAAAFSSPAPTTSGSGPDGDVDSMAARAPRRVGPTPNLVVAAANVLEVYAVRTDAAAGAVEGGTSSSAGTVLDGITGARLELVCHYRLHGNVESMAVLSDGTENRRDSIALAFKDAKIACLEFDDSTYGLRTSSMHCFEGPDWLHLKRGRESFAWGPVIKADPQGRCGAALVYGLQMIILKAAQVGQSLVGEDEPTRVLSSTAVRIESSYVIDLRLLEINHIKDFTFVHGAVPCTSFLVHVHQGSNENAKLITEESLENYSVAIDMMKRCTRKLPHDAYQLLAVPPPISGILVICANSIHYHSQSTSCSLALNGFSSQPDGSTESIKTSFHVELDVAKATWLSHDIVMFSSKNGEILLLTVVYDGRAVQRLDLVKSKASILSSGATTLGSSFFFLGSRLADSLLVQFSCGMPTSVLPDLTDESADIEGDLPFAKRLKRIPSDVLQDVTSVEELSFHNNTVPNSLDSAQKISFVVRDALINVGPLKDFAYGLRANSDPDAAGIAKQSNYELVCCSGHGKNGTLSALQQSIRPDLITEVELPSCTGIWTVYYKSSRGITSEDNEYHAYLIISLESRTMVLQTGDDLGEVTETVDYNVQASTIIAGNLFGRRRVIQVYAKGARVLDGSFMTQELNFTMHTSESSLSSESLAAASASIADPYVLLKMVDGTIRLLVGDHSTCTISVHAPAIFASSSERISSCTLYRDRGLEPWLRKARTDAWLSTGIGEANDGNDSSSYDQSDVYCIICYESAILFDVLSHISTKNAAIEGPDATKVSVKKEEANNIKIVELAMHRWSGSESNAQCSPLSPHGSSDLGNASDSRLRNLRFRRVSIDVSSRDDISSHARPRITVFNNVGGYEGLFLGGPRPTWVFVCRQRFWVHPQGFLKICQLPPAYNYDNYWPVQKVPLHGTPHQVTYYAEESLYPLIVSVPAVRPLNQVLSSMADQDLGLHIENDVGIGDDLQKVYTVDEFEVRVMELEKLSGRWENRFTIPMQPFENALTVRIVTLQNTTTKENETLMAIGTAYVQGEDVAARGRVLLFSFSRSENSQNLVMEVYSKESKGAVSAVASLQGHLLIASGPKITLNKWTGSELTAIAFYDAPLHVVSLNIVKNFVLFGDIHKSIYFLSWKEQGSQLSLLAKDFGSLDSFATEFLIDGSTLSLVVSDSDKNVQMLPTQGLVSEKTNRFALVFGTLDGGIGCIAPVDELTFRRLQSLQRKLVDAVPHVCGLNPKSFRHFNSNGKAHRPGPDNIIDFDLLAHYEMLSLEEQLDIAQQIGTTRSQILSNFSDFSLGTSFLLAAANATKARDSIQAAASYSSAAAGEAEAVRAGLRSCAQLYTGVVAALEWAAGSVAAGRYPGAREVLQVVQYVASGCNCMARAAMPRENDGFSSMVFVAYAVIASVSKRY
ncbi:putative cleavage and polyadenylation specificity factor subunit 1 [Dichanthelium oligosanthes]|uniref:Putative cleavage and polyadenylation specificity factor subunit 1 n=1 Tax=Dichanthelium oligosanthes TaxID=888268 RepID=A0A1E5WGZ2_9POAL|nr:putative cleavage and polyadenylation specificity factor subunit 1 [Dichanthelium oligosanthes]